MPAHLRDRVWIDWSSIEKRALGTQQLLNVIAGRKPFSARLRDFLGAAHPDSPYTDLAQHQGRSLLQRLVQYGELERTEVQKGLVWMLSRRWLKEYIVSIKLHGWRPGAGFRAARIIDRWTRATNLIELTPEEFDRGLWFGEFDLMKDSHRYGPGLTARGRVGRLSMDPACNPHTQEYPALLETRPVVEAITNEVMAQEGDDGGRQCMLFDLYHLVDVPDLHRVRVVFGRGSTDQTLAFSPMLSLPVPMDGPCAVFEIRDDFFRALKYTTVLLSQMSSTWEADLDMLSDESETMVGLA